MRLVKLEDRRTGWLGEGCWTAHGRRFIKRFEYRYNRRYGRKICRPRHACHYRHPLWKD